MDIFALIGLLLLGCAAPLANLIVRSLNSHYPTAGAQRLVAVAALIPAGLVLLACLVRMNIWMGPGDWGQLVVFAFAWVAVPLSLVLGWVSASGTLQRARQDRGE